MARRLNRHEVYFVRSDEDPTALIALDAHVAEGHLAWFDTNRDRGHRLAQKPRIDGEDIVFRTETGFKYRFRPLTKELYDQHVRAKVELSPGFETTEELKDFYRTNFGISPPPKAASEAMN